MSFIFHHRAVTELIAGVLGIDGIEAVSFFFFFNPG